MSEAASRDTPPALSSMAKCGEIDAADSAKARLIRDCRAEAVRSTEFFKKAMAAFDVSMTPQTLGGIYTEVFVPKQGIAPQNEHRVLINLHGGGITEGSRWASHLESVPIAATGLIKVVSVDFRLGPEYRFPAASQDVEAVYRDLLKTYKPRQIGIFGCSGGGLLAAEVIAWLHHRKLPRPGAVGIFCSGAGYWLEGDSAAIFQGYEYKTSKEHPYLASADENDSLAFPIKSNEVLRQFPPSLVISSSRDPQMSSAVATHSRLVSLGLDADLHIWEGLSHAFFYNPAYPESREAYEVIVKFFGKHLDR